MLAAWKKRVAIWANDNSVSDHTASESSSVNYHWGFHAGMVAMAKEASVVADLIDDGWVSVNDAIPSERCIAYTPDNADPSMRHRFIPPGMFRQVASDATHWRPMPEAPQ